ncbi:lysozyme inhibitor LprI family protein [Vogesella mureinivorans]|uniref:lysozyme inhibitor LprI family protein n=1 Tax=Vogesella mureinivorans TaxID=657276 RepID=UPI0011C822A2|nr:hypothetical protein [Vogesella mureinivorans]
MHHFNRLISLAVCSAAILLTACSNKPGDADIQQDLAATYECPILQVSDVKKVDGAETDGKVYEVAFTYTVSIKGGAEAAGKMFAEWSHLDAQMHPTQLALEKAQYEADVRIASGQIGGDRNTDPEVRRLSQAKEQLENRINTLVPCQSLEALSRLQIMRSAAEEAAKSGQSQIAVPVAIKMRGNGHMGKAESGWHFVDTPALSTVEVVTETANYPRFKQAEAPATTQPSTAELDPPPAQLASIAATPGYADSTVDNGPSFDCAKASTTVEKMICTDPKLAAADRDTAAAYKVKLAASADESGLKQQQANWRRSVRDICTDTDCLEGAYKQRLAELR